MPELKWSFVILGCLGGLLPDILRIIQTRHDLTGPAYIKSTKFWIGLVLLVAIGGLASWLLGASDFKQAIAYGFGAPELFSRVLGKIGGDVDRGVDRGEEELKAPGLLDWWSA